MGEEQEAYRRYEDSCSGVWPPEDFEGSWVEHWPDGSLKYRGTYQSGRKRVGQHISFWENGVLQELSYWDDGWVCGTVIWFTEDGSKECEKDYGEYGGRTRSWIERLYLDGIQPSTIYEWKEGDIVAKWTRPDLREIEREIGFDKIVQDAVRQVYPDE